jgi:hypothetical protein
MQGGEGLTRQKANNIIYGFKNNGNERSHDQPEPEF